MKSTTKIAAIILAAGYSSRMTRFKPLIPLGPLTSLQRCVNLFIDTGIDHITVVTGHRCDDIENAMKQARVKTVFNSRFDEGMFSSVVCGISSLESTPAAIFVLPADIPLVRKSTVHILRQCFLDNNSDVIYPCFLGKRGHPPLIKGSLTDEIIHFTGGDGLRGYLNSKAHLNVEVADENILMDMDYPDQYLRLMEKLADYDIPSQSECLALLKNILKADDLVIMESMKMAQRANEIMAILIAKGLRLNKKFIIASALLWKLAEDQGRHDRYANKIREIYGESLLTTMLEQMGSRDVFFKDTSLENKVVILANQLNSTNVNFDMGKWLNEKKFEKDFFRILKSVSDESVSCEQQNFTD
ncbi:MAG: NTP transferase domain-containing protein [Desulfomonilaceae bacterium]